MTFQTPLEKALSIVLELPVADARQLIERVASSTKVKLLCSCANVRYNQA